ncbi:MAG: altronate dehydratase family protein [Bacteroidetes bacterium]|nr:altronate dehydratase family protein [Bacteroidota bacterium]MDE2671985.1 altronate dehydratase family protein [Bacteroidota bacterium]
MSVRVLRIHPGDNVAVALVTLPAGTEFLPGCLTRSPVPAKHKVVTEFIRQSEAVIMYGVMVGRALRDLHVGDRLNRNDLTHDTAEYRVRSAHRPPAWQAPDVSNWEETTFLGYCRSDGQAGTANHWIVLPLVFCENRNIDVLRRAFEDELGYSRISPYRQQVAALAHEYRTGKPAAGTAGTTLASERLFQNVDGVHFLTHQLGCGGTRQDARSLCGLLAGYLNHPNVNGATVLSLGCENAEYKILMEEVHKRNPAFDKPVYIFRQQSFASADALITKAIADTFSGLREANKSRRTPVPLSKLTLGLECGGSDGFSGISANPAMGYTTDLLVALGGGAILGEFPELCGLEQSLIDRCTHESAAIRFADLMESYATLAEAVGSGFEMNPSPGNIRDGLLTDAMKSAGAARKGGTSPITAVLDYPEYSTEPGLNLLCTPGGDVESTTAIAGAGAQIILFSTGMGTPTGNPIAQVVKISSNSALAQRLPDLIDVDAGSIVGGDESVESVGARLIDFVVNVASGHYITAATRLGQHDFIPWKRGVSL